MKFSPLVLACSLAAIGHANAFAPGLKTVPSMHKTKSSSGLTMATNDEVERLRAAAAQAREEAAQLARELGKEEPASQSAQSVAVVEPTKSKEEIAEMIRGIDFTSSAEKQISALDDLRQQGCLPLYKSATKDAGSSDLIPYPVSLKMLESRTGLTSESLGVGVEEVSLDDFKYATLYVVGGCSLIGVASLAFLPENIGATICYLVAIIPVLFLGVGSTAPAAIANLIAAVKGNKGDVSQLERVCRHEAAHFLCGYLCGLPVASYAAGDEDIPRVEFYSSKDGPATAQRELTDQEVNALTVVALSGAVAEAMAFGNARGGNTDLIELEGVFMQSANFLGSEKRQDLTRWGAVAAFRLLTANKEKLDKLVNAFAAKKPVAECITILEQ